MNASSNSIDLEVYVWHARLAHIGQDRMSRLAKENLLGSRTKVNLSACEHCLVGKATRKPFGKAQIAEYPFQLIHSDVCGLIPL